MEKQTIKKVTTMSFLGSGILAYVVVNVLFKTLAGAFGPVQKIYSIDWANHGLPILAAVLAFGFLQFNSKTVGWAEDVIMEVSKVVWPSQRDTVAMTIVVCIFVCVASLLLLVIDFLAHNLVQIILQ